MTGQLSFADWMPEAVPGNEEDDLLAEFLWENASSGVRGYILGGGDSAQFLKSAYGIEGGTARFRGEYRHHIFYNAPSNGVVAVINGERKEVTWKKYLHLMQAHAKKNKGRR